MHCATCRANQDGTGRQIRRASYHSHVRDRHQLHPTCAAPTCPCSTCQTNRLMHLRPIYEWRAGSVAAFPPSGQSAQRPASSSIIGTAFPAISQHRRPANPAPCPCPPLPKPQDYWRFSSNSLVGRGRPNPASTASPAGNPSVLGPKSRSSSATQPGETSTEDFARVDPSANADPYLQATVRRVAAIVHAALASSS